MDGRGELREIVVEARELLGRQLARGRRRIAMEAVAGSTVEAGPALHAQSAAPAVATPAIPTPAIAAPQAGAAEVLALPGFESLVPSRPAAFTAAPVLTLRSDLPGDLPALEAQVSGCRLCGLCRTRTQTVFADGSPRARLLLVGEAPGRDEDAQGLPFVGRAGQLLNKMLAAIDLRREEVYICNVLKCRPPDNRTPLPEEVERCLPYLEQQIALVRPTLIGALGLSAAQALLGTKASMSSLRGRSFEYRGVPLIATYHPAALLRNPGLKREAWADLQRIRDLLCAAVPAGSAR